MKNVCLRKGNDYAGDDRLSNFKKVGAMVGSDPQMSILVLMATKVARLSELLLADKKPNNESVEDSFLDLANYAALGYMLWAEAQEGAMVPQDREPQHSTSGRAKGGCSAQTFDRDVEFPKALTRSL